MPDILLKNHPQNVTGLKVISSLHVFDHSHVGGLVNGLSLQELHQRSKQRPQTQKYDRLHVENFANFEGGLTFDRFNSLSRGQFDQLMQDSVGVDTQWSHLNLGEVSFDNLHINTLDCKKINGFSLENDLLTRNTTQTVPGPFAFNKVLLEAPSFIQSVNNFSMQHLENVFRTYGNQHIESKIFGGDIYVKSLKIKSINEMPVEDIVFMDEVKQKTITGVKHFKGRNLMFDYLTVDDINVQSINKVPVEDMIQGTLRQSIPQNVPKHIHFKSLHLRSNQDFNTYYVNGVNLRELQHDLVLNNSNTFQNVTGSKVFTELVNFDAITFSRLFMGITSWEMHNDWMVHGSNQKVDSTFTIDNLEVRNVHVHNAHINDINLEEMDSTVIRLDRKSVIHHEMTFEGLVKVQGI